VPYYVRPIHLVGSLYLTNMDVNPTTPQEGSFEVDIQIADRHHATVLYIRHGHPVIEVPMLHEAVEGMFTPILGSMSGVIRPHARQYSLGEIGPIAAAVVPQVEIVGLALVTSPAKSR
jgi:hypothetical protein